MSVALFAGLAFTLFGIYMLRHAVTNYKKAVASQSWPSVMGRLTDLSLWGLRRIDGKMQEVEKLNVEYQYEVNKLPYIGRSVTFYTLVYPETLEFSKRYAADSDVKIYYNPKDPAESVIIPGIKKDKPYSEFILGSLGVATGVGVVVLSLMGIIG